jgi:threonine aldolase
VTLRRGFRSDNNAGLCPEAVQALLDANDGSHQHGYGDDEITARAIEAFRSVFGADTQVFFVATGTAANTLAIASLTDPWEVVACHAYSHYARHESTAPERLVGCRTHAIETPTTKLAPGDLKGLQGFERGDVHEPQPGVVTLTNATEFGTVYRPEELRALCDAAHEAGYRVHVDGARFANAVAALDCDPRALCVDAGIDALSFGGTKNGLAFGEAVLFFPERDPERLSRAIRDFPYHRKSTGHLLSKHRFVAAPLMATLESGAWLRHAGHANAMAARLAKGLGAMGIEPAHPVETNGVFVRLPDAVDRALVAAGYGYYPFGDSADGLSRLLCSFDTSPEEVDALIDAARCA